MSNNQIAKEKHVDPRKVDRLIGKNTEKQTEREILKQKVVEMTKTVSLLLRLAKNWVYQ